MEDVVCAKYFTVTIAHLQKVQFVRSVSPILQQKKHHLEFNAYAKLLSKSMIMENVHVHLVKVMTKIMGALDVL